MMKTFNWSFTELYCLPVSLRSWIFDRSAEMVEIKDQ